MINQPPHLSNLIEALRCLPGIGKKSAQRISYHLLERDRDGARQLAKSLTEAMDGINHCRRCRTFSQTDICRLCTNPKRDHSQLCIIENPAEMMIIEESDYKGLYFVLMGHLSPLDGIGPEDIGLGQLEHLLDGGEIKEVILATNTTAEGEATAYFIGEIARKRGLQATRIAYGIPAGGGLEYANSRTISYAMSGRKAL